jgi:hypothetical protein
MKYKVWIEIEELNDEGEPTEEMVALPDPIGICDDLPAAMGLVRQVLRQFNPKALEHSDCQ